MTGFHASGGRTSNVLSHRWTEECCRRSCVVYDSKSTPTMVTSGFDPAPDRSTRPSKQEGYPSDARRGI
eukprot:scaffold752_cov322-Pavlova_lutheri.AAC.35